MMEVLRGLLGKLLQFGLQLRAPHTTHPHGAPSQGFLIRMEMPRRLSLLQCVSVVTNQLWVSFARMFFGGRTSSLPSLIGSRRENRGLLCAPHHRKALGSRPHCDQGSVPRAGTPHPKVDKVPSPFGVPARPRGRSRSGASVP